MWWANWISLGIIVTLLVCMAQRLVSSMGPTTYASAASCRHMMVLPWKHKSYLPTSRAISWTKCEKGSSLMRSSVLFWNCWISQRATVPGQYFLVFLTLPAWRNSFWGTLPPTVGWSFLAGSSLPSIDGLASTAIWANCQVSNYEGDLPTSSSCLASSTHFSASSICFSTSLPGEGSLAGDGWCTGEEGLHPFSARALLTSLDLRTHLLPPFSPFLGVSFVLAMLEGKYGALTNRKTAWLGSCKICLVAILNL